MLKKLAIYFGLAVSLSTSAFAFVGGPFDGGDYGQLLDDRGVYQAAFQFANGSGFAQWGSNVTSNSISTTSTTPITQSIANRTVLYHEGIVFLGSASGMVDFAAKTIQGVSDTLSNLFIYTIPSTSSTTTIDPVTGIPTTVVTTSFTTGSARYAAGIGWEGKITKSQPILRFKGQGVLSLTNTSNTTFFPVKVTGARRFFLSERTAL